MARRSRAREVALQALHQLEFNSEADVSGRSLAPSLRGFVKGRLRSTPLIEFAEALVTGVRHARADLDRLLDERSANWRVSRMAATDRLVLRIALHELLHTDTPGPVVVDEAIELARRYGTAASPRFVAGILASLLAAPPPAASSRAEN
jgi:N utilization substance protein B